MNLSSCRRVASRLLPSLVGLAGLMAASCTSQPTILPSKDFDRPEDITFVCMGAFSPAPPDGGTAAEADGGTSQELVVSGRPMRECHPRGLTDPPPGPQHRTFAFVPNSANGLLSVIDADTWKLVDLNETLAGFNQYPLGRVPSQITASDDGCRMITANHGSCDLSLIDPAALMQPTLSQQIPGLPPAAPGGLAAIGTTVSPNYGANGTLLRLLPQEVALLPQDTAALKGNEQLCPATWTGQAVVTFPSCNLIALINLPSGQIVDGMYVRRTSDGRVTPEPLAGREPQCPVDCTVGLPPGTADAGASASDATASDAGVSDAGVATSDADPDADVDGAAGGADASDASPPATVIPGSSVRPGPIAIIPGGARAYVGLTEAPFILALDLKKDQLVIPRTGGDKGVIELHTGAVGTTRLRLSVDPYADKPTAPGYSGKFVTREGALGHPDRQYLYAIARDGTLRVVHVGFDPETECETNVDPTILPNGNADLALPCLPVDKYSAFRRPSAQGPGIRLPAPPVDVAAVDVGADHSETSVSGAHAWVMAANGVVYLVNIDPVERYIRYVETSGDVKMCLAETTTDCHVESPPGAPNTPRNRNVMSFTPTLPQFDGPARLDVQATQPQIGPRIESVWTRGTANNATADTTAAGRFIKTQVFFRDPTAPVPQAWTVAWEGALMSAPRASGQILVDGATDTFAIQDPGFDYCRLGLRERDLVTLTGCAQDAQCGMGNVCRHGTEGALAAGGLPINGLCVKKDLPAARATSCDSLVSTVRRYEVTKATQGLLALRPHMDELVLPDLSPCRIPGAPPTGPAAGGADAGDDAGASADGGAAEVGTNGGRQSDGCINLNDPSTNGFQCVAFANLDTTTVEPRCLMPCDAVGSTGSCRSGRICVNFSKEPVPAGTNPCVVPGRCFCADGPDLANNEFQDACFGELLSYQVQAGRSFVVAGTTTGIQATREATPGTGVCRDIAGLDPRTVNRIPLNAPVCTNVPENEFDSRCTPDDVTSCPGGLLLRNKDPDPAHAPEYVAAQATNLQNIDQGTLGAPNPCVFWGGPNELDPDSLLPAPHQHVRALFSNGELQFMMTNLERPISGAYLIRFEVHGGVQTQTVYNPPSIEVGMPTRIVLGPFDAQVPSTTDQILPEVPYMFVVDQRRLGRTTGGGPTRGQVLRIQPRGRAITVPTEGAQPWFEDFKASGELFPIQ